MRYKPQRRRIVVNTKQPNRRLVPLRPSVYQKIKAFLEFLDIQRKGKLGITLNGKLEPWWRRRKFRNYREFETALTQDFKSGAIPQGIVVKGIWFK